MWLSFNSETIDLELTDYADRYLTDAFSTVEGVSRVRLEVERNFPSYLVGPYCLSCKRSNDTKVKRHKENINFQLAELSPKT